MPTARFEPRRAFIAPQFATPVEGTAGRHGVGARDEVRRLPHAMPHLTIGGNLTDLSSRSERPLADRTGSSSNVWHTGRSALRGRERQVPDSANPHFRTVSALLHQKSGHSWTTPSEPEADNIMLRSPRPAARPAVRVGHVRCASRPLCLR
jgi:hypothetical protein